MPPTFQGRNAVIQQVIDALIVHLSISAACEGAKDFCTMTQETQEQTVHPTSYLQTVTKALGRVCKSCKRPRLGICRTTGFVFCVRVIAAPEIERSSFWAVRQDLISCPVIDSDKGDLHYLVCY